MPFETGQSGNPAGRPKGKGNKVTMELREKISNFLEIEFATVQKDFRKLEPRDRLKFYLDLLGYAIPKLQSASLDLDFDKLKDAQLDLLIDQITNGQIKK